MEEVINYMVRVNCITYNHAPYIIEAMNGFSKQQTDFPFVCTIIDDASTDGEPEVIYQYLQKNFDLEDNATARKEETDDYILTFARHITNKNCFFAVILLKYNHFSIKKSKLPYIAKWENTKYIALCEGDDYWIAPDKLQKQVDFLELHSDYNLVYTDVNSYYEESGILIEGFFNHGIYKRVKNTYKDEILWGWYLAPCTWVYRNGIVKYPEKRNPSLFYGDIFLVLSLSQKGKIQYLNEVTSVYRVLPESASHSKDSMKSFCFWKKGRYTRAMFASKQSLLFRVKFFIICSIVAMRSMIKSNDIKHIDAYLLMIKQELSVLF